jgi:hypothetical protein
MELLWLLRIHFKPSSAIQPEKGFAMNDKLLPALARKVKIVAVFGAIALSAGCVSNSSKPDQETESKPTAAAPTNTTAATAKPAAATKPAASAVKSTAGMDNQGNVIDPTKVESGSGQQVKVGEWEGEITGKPVPKSKFARLKIGMSMKEATDIAGQPTDQGAYMTGKAWIPFYFGGDKHRYELTYKGHGRLIFAGGGMGDFTSGHLIWIIHSANETGYR